MLPEYWLVEGGADTHRIVPSTAHYMMSGLNPSFNYLITALDDYGLPIASSGLIELDRFGNTTIVQLTQTPPVVMHIALSGHPISRAQYADWICLDAWIGEEWINIPLGEGTQYSLFTEEDCVEFNSANGAISLLPTDVNILFGLQYRVTWKEVWFDSFSLRVYPVSRLQGITVASDSTLSLTLARNWSVLEFNELVELESSLDWNNMLSDYGVLLPLGISIQPFGCIRITQTAIGTNANDLRGLRPDLVADRDAILSNIAIHCASNGENLEVPSFEVAELDSWAIEILIEVFDARSLDTEISETLHIETMLLASTGPSELFMKVDESNYCLWAYFPADLAGNGVWNCIINVAQDQFLTFMPTTIPLGDSVVPMPLPMVLEMPHVDEASLYGRHYPALVRSRTPLLELLLHSWDNVAQGSEEMERLAEDFDSELSDDSNVIYSAYSAAHFRAIAVIEDGFIRDLIPSSSEGIDALVSNYPYSRIEACYGMVTGKKTPISSLGYLEIRDIGQPGLACNSFGSVVMSPSSSIPTFVAHGGYGEDECQHWLLEDGDIITTGGGGLLRMDGDAGCLRYAFTNNASFSDVESLQGLAEDWASDDLENLGWQIGRSLWAIADSFLWYTVFTDVARLGLKVTPWLSGKAITQRWDVRTFSIDTARAVDLSMVADEAIGMTSLIDIGAIQLKELVSKGTGSLWQGSAMGDTVPYGTTYLLKSTYREEIISKMHKAIDSARTTARAELGSASTVHEIDARAIAILQEKCILKGAIGCPSTVVGKIISGKNDASNLQGAVYELAYCVKHLIAIVNCADVPVSSLSANLHRLTVGTNKAPPTFDIVGINGVKIELKSGHPSAGGYAELNKLQSVDASAQSSPLLIQHTVSPVLSDAIPRFSSGAVLSLTDVSTSQISINSMKLITKLNHAALAGEDVVLICVKQYKLICEEIVRLARTGQGLKLNKWVSAELQEWVAYPLEFSEANRISVAYSDEQGFLWGTLAAGALASDAFSYERYYLADEMIYTLDIDIQSSSSGSSGRSYSPSVPSPTLVTIVHAVGFDETLIVHPTLGVIQSAGWSSAMIVNNKLRLVLKHPLALEIFEGILAPSSATVFDTLDDSGDINSTGRYSTNFRGEEEVYEFIIAEELIESWVLVVNDSTSDNYSISMNYQRTTCPCDLLDAPTNRLSESSPQLSRWIVFWPLIISLVIAVTIFRRRIHRQKPPPAKTVGSLVQHRPVVRRIMRRPQRLTWCSFRSELANIGLCQNDFSLLWSLYKENDFSLAKAYTWNEIRKMLKGNSVKVDAAARIHQALKDYRL